MAEILFDVSFCRNGIYSSLESVPEFISWLLSFPPMPEKVRNIKRGCFLFCFVLFCSFCRNISFSSLEPILESVSLLYFFAFFLILFLFSGIIFMGKKSRTKRHRNGNWRIIKH